MPEKDTAWDGTEFFDLWGDDEDDEVPATGPDSADQETKSTWRRSGATAGSRSSGRLSAVAADRSSALSRPSHHGKRAPLRLPCFAGAVLYTEKAHCRKHGREITWES